MERSIVQVSVTDPELIEIIMDSLQSGTASTKGGDVIIVGEAMKEMDKYEVGSMEDLEEFVSIANVIERDKFRIATVNLRIAQPDEILNTSISNVVRVTLAISILHPLWMKYGNNEDDYDFKLVPRLVKIKDQPDADFEEPIDTTTYLGFDLLVTPKSVSKTKTTTKGGSANGSRKKKRQASTGQNQDK